jgi:hypothetical protein
MYKSIKRSTKDTANYFGFGTSEDTTKKYQDAVNDVSKSVNKLNLSLPILDYKLMANALETAMRGPGHDRSVILDQFGRLSNIDDLKQLIVSFGIRSGEDLGSWLINEFVTYNFKTIRKEVNNILEKKGINFKF